MKLGIGTIVLDGMPTLPYVIEFAQAMGTKVCIVEGFVPAAGKRRVNEDGWCSCDGTRDVLEKAAALPHVTVLRRGAAPDKVALWNAYLDVLGDCDYLLNLDADEIPSSPNSLMAELEWMEEHPEIDRLDLPVIHFFRDVHHTVSGANYAHPFRRIWRLFPGARFREHRPPFLRTGETSHVSEHLTLYHYSWIGEEKARRKAEFYVRLRPKHPHYSRYLEWWEKVYMGRSPKTKLGLHPVLKPGQAQIFPFTGQHPWPIAHDIESGKFNVP